MTSIDAAPEGLQRSTYVDPVIFERLLKGADFFAVAALAWVLLLDFGSRETAGFLEFSSLASVFLGFLMLICLRALNGYKVSTWVKPVRASLVGASCAVVAAVGVSLVAGLTPHTLNSHWIIWFGGCLLAYFMITRVSLNVWLKAFAP